MIVAVKRPKIGIMLATNDSYARQSCVLLCSILENNENASESEKVEITVYLYADNWSENSLKKVGDLCDRYQAELIIKNPYALYKRVESVCGSAWAGKHNNQDSSTYAPDIRIFVAEEIQTEYNILCLDSDMLMLPGANLHELATWNFSKNHSFAAVIDLQNNKQTKDTIGLSAEEIVFNNGLMLVNPKRYAMFETGKRIDARFRNVADDFSVYYNVMRNAYALKDDIEALPLNYMVFPPMCGWIKTADWIWMFDVDKRNYYTGKEIKDAIEHPIFVHYVNWVVRKPWLSYEALGNIEIPFFEEWKSCENMAGITFEREEAMNGGAEAFRFWMYKYFYKLYIWLCGMANRKEIKRRNKVIQVQTEKRKNVCRDLNV